MEEVEEELRPFFKLGQLEVRFANVTHQRDVLMAALERLDLDTTFDDSHSPYHTFNEDEAAGIRAAIALVKALREVSDDGE